MAGWEQSTGYDVYFFYTKHFDNEILLDAGVGL
jgi:hypothetical protein